MNAKEAREKANKEYDSNSAALLETIRQQIQYAVARGEYQVEVKSDYYLSYTHQQTLKMDGYNLITTPQVGRLPSKLEEWGLRENFKISYLISW